MGADPLAVVRAILAAARRAGYSFEEAWPLGAEAALSYLSKRRAEEWWDVLDATRPAWLAAYSGEPTPLDALPRG